MIDFGFALFLLSLAGVGVLAAGFFFMVGLLRSIGMLP